MLKQLLKKNGAAQRIKAIKDLLLEKLDNLIEHSEQLKQKQQELQQELKVGQEQQSQQGNQLLENQIFLLKSALETGRTIESLLVSSRALLENSQRHQTELQSIWREFEKIRDEAQSSNQIIHGEFRHIRDEAQSSNQIIHGEFRHIRDEANSYQQLLMAKFLEMQDQNREQDSFAKTTLGQIAADVHDQKFKLVTDPSYFQAIDIELMVYLYSFLPHRRAIDVGANRGDVSIRLLQTGYEVYAFEPFPPVLAKLQERLGDNSNFHAFPYALGATCETKELHVAADQTADNTYDDPTFYNSLTPHSLSEGLVFTDTIPVTVKTLASLHEEGDLPSDIGLVKIDTEGFDLEVIKGMADYRYPVVVAEFWDPSFPFGQTGAMNHLKDVVPAMRNRGYGWHIVIYRIWGNQDISFYCNADYSLANSWGNVFFFQDHGIFSQALQWCSSTMPATYFAV